MLRFIISLLSFPVPRSKFHIPGFFVEIFLRAHSWIVCGEKTQRAEAQCKDICGSVQLRVRSVFRTWAALSTLALCLAPSSLSQDCTSQSPGGGTDERPKHQMFDTIQYTPM